MAHVAEAGNLISGRKLSFPYGSILQKPKKEEPTERADEQLPLEELLELQRDSANGPRTCSCCTVSVACSHSDLVVSCEACAGRVAKHVLNKCDTSWEPVKCISFVTALGLLLCWTFVYTLLDYWDII